MESGHIRPKKRSPYLPKLCSSASIKDGCSSKSKHIPSFSSSSSSSSSYDEPSSPRVSCTGQVKGGSAFSNSNRYRFFTASASASRSIHAKSHKFRGNFLRRNSTGSTCTVRRMDPEGTSARGYECQLTLPEANIAGLDPPLPVVKRVKDPGLAREEVNLWKRRSKFAWKSSELSLIHIPKYCYFQSNADDAPGLKIPPVLKVIGQG